MSCLARQESDQKVCHACGLVWDMNDPEPPECRRDWKPAPATPPEPVPARSRAISEPCTVAALEPSTWRPSPRTELAARLRRVLAMQSGPGQNPIAVAITPNLARDILAELERIP